MRTPILIFGCILVGFISCTKKDVHYTCMEGTQFEAHFQKGIVRLHIQNRDIELPLTKTPVGLRYTDGKITFGFKGKAAYVLDGDQMIDFGCVEQGR